MDYILGLDIGTSSIGLAAYKLDDNDKMIDLFHMESYLFKEPSEKRKRNEYYLKNQKRREKRLSRRQTDRKKKRFRKLYHFFIEYGLLSPQEIEKARTNKQEDIYQLRARALKEKISLFICEIHFSIPLL